MIILQYPGCGGDNKQKALDMITTRTLGLAYLEENNLPAAELAFQQLIDLAPKEALGYANLGLVYTRMGKYEDAEIQFEHALQIAPNDPEIKFNQAEMLMLTNRGEEALKNASELLYRSIQRVIRLIGFFV